MKPIPLMNPVMRRLIRVESKLHNLMDYIRMPQGKQHEADDKPLPPLVNEAEIMRVLVRIESKLQALMLHEGLNPHTRV